MSDAAEQPERGEQRRRDDRLGEREGPGHQPAEERAEAAGDVGVHATGRRQVAGELADRVGREQGRDEREDHRERRDCRRRTVVAAPIERAVATAGAMWVMDWNRTSVSPIAPRSSPGSPDPAGRVRGRHRFHLRSRRRRRCLRRRGARIACILGRPSRPAIAPPTCGPQPRRRDDGGVATLGRDGSARHRAARVARRACRGGRRPRARRIALGRRCRDARASTATRSQGGHADPGPALAAAAGPPRGPGRGSAGSASRPSTTSRKRLAVPPAEAYGVATFYALYATKPRPPVVAHVCDDIACRIAGAERICDDLARALGRGRRARSRRPDRLAAVAVPGPVRPRAGRDGHRGRGTGDATSAPRRSTRPGSSRGWMAERHAPTGRHRRSARPAAQRPAAAAAGRRRRSRLARRLPRARRLRAASPARSRSAPRRSSPRSRHRS